MISSTNDDDDDDDDDVELTFPRRLHRDSTPVLFSSLDFFDPSSRKKVSGSFRFAASSARASGTNTTRMVDVSENERQRERKKERETRAMISAGGVLCC